MTSSNRNLAPAISIHPIPYESGSSSEDRPSTPPLTDHTLLSLQVPPSSPTANSLGGDTLRSRANSFNSTAETTRSRANSDLRTISRYEGDELTAEEALCPDKTNEKDFEIENNPFAFSPGQLNKNLNPKSLAAFRALGGLRGLERGLKTDTVAGLSVDETTISEKITFEEATHAATIKKSSHARTVIGHEEIVSGREVPGQFEDRKRVYKDNRLPTKKSLSIWKLFWNAYNDRILQILTAAAVISLALGIYEAVSADKTRKQQQSRIAAGEQNISVEPPSLDWVEGLAIVIAIVIVVLVTGLNDYRKEKQFVTLNAKKDDRVVKAVRSGKSIMISVFDVMVGDVLHMESGDSIPADGILISGHGIRCDESSATGESDAMKKVNGEEVWNRIVEGTATSKLDPFIISGSKVLEGVGTYLVTSVGVNSSFGKIMVSLQTKNEPTPLQAKLTRMANWIGALGTSAAGFLFFILLIRFLVGLADNTASAAKKGSQFLDIFIVAITIIVVAVPEGLPLAVTLALSFATKRMYKENNLVRKLNACETMGNATTICSDKTGTLTQNKMTVVAGMLGTRSFITRIGEINEKGAEQFSTAFARLSPKVRYLMLQSVAINSTAFEGEENGIATFIGSKTETAILTLAKENLGMGPVAEERAGVEITQLIPFDSDRKCMGVVIRLASGSYRLLVKGAAELMLAKATKELVDETEDNLISQDLNDLSRQRASQAIEDFASKSLRTIGMLYKDFPQWPPAGARRVDGDKSMVVFEDVFQDMTILAILGIQDPLRDGVSQAVKQCQAACVKVRMVTGDNITTASAIASECGIKTADGIAMEGPKFRQLSDEDMDALLPRLQVLARSSPDDKRILVARLKHLGETVAVTGDGTNDGPALKTADVGFSMGIAGTEVAKEASAIILMDDNFSSIVKAIMWGRSVNDAVSKFLQFQITVNITAVILAFVSAVSSPDMHSVLSAVQLLWVNLIMDTFAALALATDAPTEKILNRPPVPKRAALITTNMWKMIIGQAIYQLAVTFTLYFAGAQILGYHDLDANNHKLREELNTVVFNTFVWMQIFNEFNNRRLDNNYNIFEGVLKNYFFIGINCVMVGGQVMIVFVGGKAFQIRRIDGTQWAVCILCALPCLLWAILLRTIPDKYAAALFTFVGKVWFAIFRPVMRAFAAIFRPVGKAYRATKRTARKALGQKAPEGQEQDPKDEEAAIQLDSVETSPAESPQTPPGAGLPTYPQGSPPPITLTSA